MRSEDEIRRHLADLDAAVALYKTCPCLRCVALFSAVSRARDVVRWALAEGNDYGPVVAELRRQGPSNAAHAGGHRNN